MALLQFNGLGEGEEEEVTGDRALLHILLHTRETIQQVRFDSMETLTFPLASPLNNRVAHGNPITELKCHLEKLLCFSRLGTVHLGWE